jgi:hypothetical protein
MSKEADKLEGITMEEWYGGLSKIESTEPAVRGALNTPIKDMENNEVEQLKLQLKVSLENQLNAAKEVVELQNKNRELEQMIERVLPDLPSYHLVPSWYREFKERK